MTVTRIRYDLESRLFLDDKGAQLTSLAAKVGERRKFEIAIQAGGLPYDPPGSASLVIAIKDPASSTTLLASANGVKIGLGTGSRWICDLDLNTVELATRVGTAASAVALGLELTIVIAAQTLISGTLTFNASKRLLTDSDIAATPVGSIQWIYRYDIVAVTDIQAIPTIQLGVGTLISTVFTISGVLGRRDYQLVTGVADIAPGDFNSSTNNKQWLQVGGP